MKTCHHCAEIHNAKNSTHTDHQYTLPSKSLWSLAVFHVNMILAVLENAKRFSNDQSDF